MKRIELFINSLQSGGAEHQICYLANFLAEKGYEVTLTTINDSEDHYPLDSRVKRVRISKQSGSSFIKIIQVFAHFLFTKCDCLIAYCQRNIYYALRSLSYRPFNRPKVICSERNFMSKPGKYEKELYGGLYQKLASAIVSNSYSQAGYIKTKLPALADKVCTIVNYTDLDKFSPSIHKAGLKKRIIVAARFQKQKNCLRFADAIYELKQQGYTDFVVDWYGSRSYDNSSLQGYYDAFYAKLKEYAIEDMLTVHDPIPDVSSILNDYDIVCLPSLYEGFSNSIAEGISCGKPMIVSDVSDNGVMVKEGSNGFLFNPEDTASIVAAFVRLLTTEDAALIEMGRRSRSLAESLFDKESFISSYVNLIEN